MKSVLRFLCFCFVFTILLSTNMNKVNVYSETDKLTVDIGESFGSTDSNIFVPVDLFNLPSSGISAMNFVIEFDGNLILNDVRPGELININSDFSYYLKGNKVHVLFSDSSAGTNPIKDEGTLCYLKFKVFNSINKAEFSINRVTSDNEIFVNNSLGKIDASFKDGKIISKDKLFNVSKDKIWEITFNKEIDPYSLRNNSIEVRDINGVKIHISYILTNGGKTLEIYPPEEGYELYKSYSITIKNSFSSKKGLKLSKEQKIDFFIRN